MDADRKGTKTNAVNEAETVKPIAQPLFSKGKSPPIRDKTMMLIMARPAPSKNMARIAEPRFWEKKSPNAPILYIATPKRYSDLCLNLMVKAPMTRATMRPMVETTTPRVLAVPIETLNDDAISGRSVLKKLMPAVTRNVLRSNTGSNSRLLRVWLALECSAVMLAIIRLTAIKDFAHLKNRL